MTDGIAWAAGLFEGEGSMTLRPRKGGARLGVNRHIQLAMTDLDVVERFQCIVGAGAIYTESRAKLGYKTMYRWSCGRWPDIERIVRLFLPYFGIRRSAKAQELLASPARAPGGLHKARCVRGHALDGPEADVYLHGGVRHCRPCTNERNRDYRRRAA